MDVFLHGVFCELTSNQALNGIQGVSGVCDSLAFRRRADKCLTVFHVGDDRRSRARAFGVLKDLDLTAVHDRHTTVGGAKVDTDNLAHGELPFKKSEFGECLDALKLKYLDIS
jgi:hypothetical protein